MNWASKEWHPSKRDSSRFTPEQYDQLPETLQCRLVRYRVTGRKEVLTIVTTLVDAETFKAQDIAELYGLRWDVELDIACWKTTMGYGLLRSALPNSGKP